MIIRIATNIDLLQMQEVAKGHGIATNLEKYITGKYKTLCKAKVAVIKDKIVGFIIFGTREIFSLYVAEKYKSKGIGSQLLLHAEKAIERNSKLVALNVEISNPEAIKFYEKRGYIYHDTIGQKMYCLIKKFDPTAELKDMPI